VTIKAFVPTTTAILQTTAEDFDGNGTEAEFKQNVVVENAASCNFMPGFKCANYCSVYIHVPTTASLTSISVNQDVNDVNDFVQGK
jgi:hypothetical protein